MKKIIVLIIFILIKTTFFVSAQKELKSLKGFYCDKNATSEQSLAVIIVGGTRKLYYFDNKVKIWKFVCGPKITTETTMVN